jgi:NAD dependent epimerase/dehydratase family enzyme
MPRLLVPLGCWMLRTEPVLALTGRRAIPARLMDRGFNFDFPDLSPALRNIFHDSRPS